MGLRGSDTATLHFDNVRVSNDQMLGPEGEGFERFNIACPRSLLEEAMDRIKRMVDELESV